MALQRYRGFCLLTLFILLALSFSSPATGALEAPAPPGAGRAARAGLRDLGGDAALLGYWSLDEAAGNLLDASEFHADLVPYNGALQGQPGQVGQAVSFDGYDDYLRCLSDRIDVRGSFSAGGWVRIDPGAPGSLMMLMANGDWSGYTGGWDLSIEGDQLRLGIRTTQPFEPWDYEVYSGASLPRDTWVFVTGVFDAAAGSLTVYVDGVAQGQAAVDPQDVDPASIPYLELGGSTTPGLVAPAYFQGRLDEMFFLGRALSGAEVQQLYDGSFTPQTVSQPGWQPGFGLSPMGARLWNLLEAALRPNNYWLWFRGAGGAVRSQLDPQNGLKQAIVALLAQAGTLDDAAFEAALDDAALVAWAWADFSLAAQSALPPDLQDLARISLNAAQDEIEPASFYVTNLYAQTLTLQVTASGLGALEGHVVLRYAGPESSGDGLLSILYPLDPPGGDNRLEIPPLSSRQIWVELDSHDLAPGTYGGQILLAPQAYPDGFQPPGESVALEVQIQPLRLPAQVPFGTYSYNFGTSDPTADLVRHRNTWFTLSAPAVNGYDVGSGSITLDFTGTDATVAEARSYGGKLISAFGFVRSLQLDHGLDWNNPAHQPLIRSYFTQWIDHMDALGVGYDAYAIYLWDEPDAATTSKVLDLCPQLRAARPQVRLVNSLNQIFTAGDVTQWQGCLDYFIPIRYALEHNAPLVDAFETVQAGGARVWTYDQKAYQNDALTIDPIDLYRRQPWRTVWNQGFDGVSFFSSAYAYATTPGQVTPGKGMEGWREGIEDVQWLVMLRQRVDELRALPDLGGIPEADVQTAEALLAGTRDENYLSSIYASNSVVGERILRDTRAAALASLVALQGQEPPDEPDVYVYLPLLTAGLDPAPDFVIDDFEGPEVGDTRWLPYAPHLTCTPDSPGYNSAHALRMDLAIPAGTYTGCGRYVDTGGWVPAEGLRLTWRSDTPGLTFSVALLVGDSFYASHFVTGGAAWETVFLPWDSFVKGDGSGARFSAADVPHVWGLNFDVGDWQSAQYGSIWVDDLRLATVAAGTGGLSFKGRTE